MKGAFRACLEVEVCFVLGVLCFVCPFCFSRLDMIVIRFVYDRRNSTTKTTLKICNVTRVVIRGWVACFSCVSFLPDGCAKRGFAVF